MKKILVSIVVMLLLIPFSASALEGYYDNVKIDTSFSTDLDINQVGVVIVEVRDADNNSYEFELSPENNYVVNAKELFTYSDLVASVTCVNKAYYGELTINYDNDTNPVINVLVKKNATEPTQTEKKEEYSKEEIEEAQKKLKAKERRYTVYKIMFTVILVIIVLSLCIAGIKIVNANK